MDRGIGRVGGLGESCSLWEAHGDQLGKDDFKAESGHRQATLSPETEHYGLTTAPIAHFPVLLMGK